MEWSDFARSTVHWDHILDHPVTVILGDPGTGKSTEFERQAEKLRADGKIAFNLTVTDVSLNKLEDALDASMLDAWERWRASDNLRAWFFIDSVDEARVNNRDIRTAFRNLSRGIHTDAHRANVIVSSRPAAWFSGDKELVSHALLEVCNRSQSMSSGEEVDELLDPIFQRDGVPHHGKPRVVKLADERKDVALLRLLPLDQSQREDYIRACSPSRGPDILEAAGSAPHALFLGRPLDIDNAIAYWEENLSFGTRYEMMDAGVSRGLSESNPNRIPSGKLSIQDFRYAACTLAASLAFGQAFQFSQESSAARDVVSCQEVLPYLSEEKLSEFLDRALFPPANHATQRMLREHRDFLTAEWLMGLRKNGLPIADLLLATLVGVDDIRTIRPSMRSIASWIAQRDPSFREKLVEVDALALFEGGDPSLIPLDERYEILESYIRYLDRADDWRPLLYDNEASWFSNGLSDQDIQELWSRYKSVKARIVLSLIIECGERQTLIDLVLSSAVSAETTNRLRRRTIQTIAVIGDSRAKEQLASAARESKLEWPSVMLDSLVEALLLEAMPLPELRRQLIRIDASYEAERVVDSICSIVSKFDDLEALGVLLLKLVLRSPLDGGYRPLSIRFGFLLPALQKICEECLLRESMPIALFPALKLVHRAHHYRGEAKVDSSNIVAASQKNAVFRRSLIEFVLISDSEAQQKPWMLHHDWPVQIDDSDVDWALDAVRSGQKSDIDIALVEFVFWGISQRESRASMRKKLGLAVRSKSHLKNRLKELDRKRTQVLKEHKKYEHAETARKLERRSEEENAHESWRELHALLSREPHRIISREGLRPNQPPPYSLYLTHWIRAANGRSNQSYTQSSSKLLYLVWGAAVQGAYEQAVVSYWPHSDIGLESKGELLTNWNDVGFMGITTLAEQNPTWASELKADEAKVAARYGVRDLNLFPVWFETLVENQTEIVGHLFEKEARWELTTPNDAPVPHHCVYKLGYAVESVQSHLVPRLLSVVEKTKIENTQVLLAALKVLVPIFRAKNQRHILLCKERFLGAKKDLWNNQLTLLHAQYWLAAWFYCDAAGALSALEDAIKNRAQVKRDLFVGGVVTKLVSRSELAFASSQADFDQSRYLMRLTELAYLHVRPADDVIHEGVHSLGRRDEEERSRSGLLERTTRSLGVEAPGYLRRIAKKPWISISSEHWLQRASDLEVELEDSVPWTVTQVLEFAAMYNKPVNTARDLFDLANRVLDEIRLDSERGDFALDVLRTSHVEAHHQQYLARELNWHSRKRFVVSREEEVHSKKRPDIVLKNQRAGRVAIEIKVVDGSWSYGELMDASKTQIIHRYLRDKNASYAVFILIRCKKQKWKNPKGGWVNFETLVNNIRLRTAKVVERSSEVDAIAVIPIDLRA